MREKGIAIVSVRNRKRMIIRAYVRDAGCTSSVYATSLDWSCRCVRETSRSSANRYQPGVDVEQSDESNQRSLVQPTYSWAIECSPGRVREEVRYARARKPAYSRAVECGPGRVREPWVR